MARGGEPRRQRPVTSFALIVLIAACLILAACGFRPRGSVSLPADFQHIYVDAPDSIASALEVFLNSGGANLTDAKDDADALFKVSSEEFLRRVTAVDPFTGKEREIELVYVVEFSVKLKDGTMLLAPQSVSLRRQYIFDESFAIGTQREDQVIRDEMRRDAAVSIVRRTEAALGM
jgi:LPS-assembly lipoprotein